MIVLHLHTKALLVESYITIESQANIKTVPPIGANLPILSFPVKA